MHIVRLNLDKNQLIEKLYKEYQIPLIYLQFHYFNFIKGIFSNCSTFCGEKKINFLILAALADSIKHNFPSQSTFFKESNSFARLVEASIIAVIPFKQGGIVSGRVKSP